ncbi:toxin-activating lysine-acyltransferase [Morganella morganii subsp. morganii]|nr:toxin-activating lysine-acyltransferase [Morganella morganii subsp. morganii]
MRSLHRRISDETGYRISRNALPSLRSGDRIWLFDRIAPSDENNEMADLMMGTIFPDRCFRKKHNRIHRSRNEKNHRGAHYFIIGRMCR